MPTRRRSKDIEELDELSNVLARLNRRKRNILKSELDQAIGVPRRRLILNITGCRIKHAGRKNKEAREACLAETDGVQIDLMEAARITWMILRSGLLILI